MLNISQITTVYIVISVVFGHPNQLNLKQRTSAILRRQNYLNSISSKHYLVSVIRISHKEEEVRIQLKRKFFKTQYYFATEEWSLNTKSEMILHFLFTLCQVMAIFASIFLIYLLAMSCYMMGTKYVFEVLYKYLVKMPFTIFINIATIINLTMNLMNVPRIWIEILT